mgnify:CR=1 FL=1
MLWKGSGYLVFHQVDALNNILLLDSDFVPGRGPVIISFEAHFLSFNSELRFPVYHSRAIGSKLYTDRKSRPLSCRIPFLAA